jgi:ATP phosphoribosyltransferase regulatory subunit
VALLGAFADAGYRKISPPAIEFDNGKDFDEQAQKFKFTDPISQQIISLRSDITPQISRIALSRLTSQELPLRLCYYGDIFKATPINIQGDRQLKQVGLELITQDLQAEYDIEILRIAIESLTKLGLKNLTIDLNTPNLVKSLDEDYDAEILEALRKKELAKLPLKLRRLTEFSGIASKAFAALDEDLSAKARAQIEYVQQVYQGLNALKLPAKYTIDFVENRSSSYQEKLSFSIFSGNVRDVVGRGGRYKTTKSTGGLHATGFSLYLNNFLQVIN